MVESLLPIVEGLSHWRYMDIEPFVNFVRLDLDVLLTGQE
jgi:hypothetical protein